MIRYLQTSKKIYFFLIVLLNLILGVSTVSGQVSTLQAWTMVYHGTLTTAQSIAYTVPTGSNARRVLVVAIASSRTTVGLRTVTLTYGGQTLTSVLGDMATTSVRQHTQLYYLNEAGLDAATNTTLSVTVSGGTTRITDVFAAVFDNVNQSSPITNSQIYSSGTGTTSNPIFATALTVNANDQAVEIISCLRSGSTIPRTITYAPNWTMIAQQTYQTTDGVRNAVANRSIPATDATDVSSTTFSGTALASMTGMSLKAAPTPSFSGLTAGPSICFGTATVTLSGTVSATGPVYPANGETVGVTINGSTQNATISGAAGGFSINFTSAAIPSSGIPYTITYSYAGGGNLKAAANNTSTALTVKPQVGNNSLDFTNGLHGTICGTAAENANAVLTAPSGTVFINVGFTSYGTPTGTCPAFTLGACNALTSQSVTEGYLLGNNTASIPATNGVFGDPCSGTVKSLYVMATYTEPICAGSTPAGLTGTSPTGGSGTYVYLWESSTTSAVAGFATASGTSNTQNYTPGSLTQTTWYRRTVTSGGCSSTSAVIQITVTPLPVATFSYTGTPYCSNAANPLPTYSGGGVAGTFSSTAGLVFVSTATGQVNLSVSTAGTYTVTNTIAASGGCGIVTATTSVTINPILPVSISIAPSVNPVCSGTSVTFTATPTNGGTTPAYQWKVNGINAGTNSAYTYVPANNDAVTCVLTSNATCVSGNPATSNSVTMTVNLLPTTTYTLTANPSTINYGSSSILSLSGSQTGVNYQLRIGTTPVGSAVAGTGSAISFAAVSPTSNTTYNVFATNATTGCNIQQTSTVTVTVLASCITTDPSNVTICSSAGTSFSIVATGSPSYQWQVSTDNGVSWTNITAAGADPVYAGWTTLTLSLTATVPSNNGYQYRCVLTGGCTQTSNAATLTLQIINITYTLSASPSLVSIAGSSTLALSGSQTNVNYQLRTGTTAIGSPVAGTGSSISFATVNPTTSTQYNVLATTSTGGCSAQITDTRTITVNETGIIISLTTCNGQPGLNFFTNSEFGTTATNNYQTPDQGKFPGVILGNPLGGYTNYTYGLVSDAIPDGNYVIANSTAGMYRAPQQIMGTDVWLLTGDRSGSPDGHMYIVNASNTPGEFYTETLTNLCENTRYEFSAEMINLYAANWVPYGPDYLSYFPIDGQGNRYSILPNVDFMLDGKVALNTGNIMNDGNWKTFGFTFRTAPGQTSITLSMRNNSTGGIGNDIALDNIIMRSCGPVIDIEIETTLPVCPGVAVTMSANLIASDYLTPEYQWQISTDNGVTWNNISGATGSSYTSNNPAYGDMFRFIVGETIPNLSNPNCSVPSNPVSITTTAGITSTTPGSVCGSGTITLGATANSGSTINWYANLTGGTSLGTGNSFTTPTISTTTTYYVEATNGGCTSNPRTPVIATVNSGFTASVSISASTGNSICNGTSVTFTATPTNGGATPTYQWKLNGADVGTNSTTYTNNSLVDGNIVSCVMTSSISGCISGSPATSNTITMAVGTSMTASVSISANPGNTICQGTSVTFTAVATNGGATPNYQWKNNAIDIFGAVSNIYTTSSLVQSDVITCVMTTSLPCATGSPATSNGITMTVYNTLTAGISGGSSPICYNTAPGTFTATGGGGTGSYTYLWYKDGSTTGVTTQTYAPGNLTATSTFYCAITSGICGTVNTSTTTITVTALPTATIIYSGTPFCTTIITAQPITLNGTGAYTGGTYGSTAGLTIDIGTGAVIPSTSTPGTYTVTYTIPASGGCGIVTVTTPVTINLNGYWTGSLSTDWNTPGNWACNQLPTLTTDVIIANGKPNYPTLSTGSPGMSRNLTIGSSSSVTITGNILQIAGSITNSGTLFTATAGTVEMKGSGAQTIGANVFAGNTIMNLTINNSAGVTLQGTLSVTGIVSTTAGNLSSGGNLTLVSNASQTALIDGSGAGSVTGSVTMQRYLSSGLGYKYFSSPFSDADVAAFSSYLSTNATIPKFYAYDEDNHRDSSNSVAYMSGWVNYAGTLSPMYGYAANLGDVSSAKTVSITGTVNNGSKSVTLYNHNRKYTKGFNLVGNPYPSPIDWGAASGWTKTNIDGAIYFFNASGTQYTGAYSSSVNGIGSGIIPSMQGFFVHVTNGSYPVTATLGMNNNVRVNNDLSSGFSKSGYSGDIRPIISLTAGYADEKNPIDPVVVYFDEKATIEFNSKLDALKLMNTDVKVPNFYALSSDANRLSIRAIPYPDSMSVVPLGLKTEQAGWISFRATGIENMPPGLQIYFSDNKTGIHTDLLQSTGFKLNMIAGTVENRFSMIFSNRKLSDTQDSNDAFVVYSSDGKLIVSFTGTEGEKGDMVINNMIGQELWRKQIIGTGIHEFDPQLKTGVYIVSFYSGKDIYSKKVLITNQ